MIRRKRPDLYPEFHVTFVKDKKIADVIPVSLSDLGFANDVAYPDQPIDEIPKEIVIAMEEEFIYLIEELLPRNIQDLFYKMGLDPRPAYWKLYEMAANDFGLERYTNPNDNKFNQFVTHTQEGIIELFDMGWKLSEIYENTCVTKTMIVDTAYSAKKPQESTQDSWGLIDIEVALFKKNLKYERNVTMDISDEYDYIFDFVVYESEKPILAIQLEFRDDFMMMIDTELQESEKECFEVVQIRDRYCEEHHITLLRLLEDEYFWNDVSWGKLIYKTMKDPGYAKKHDDEIITMIQEMEEDDGDWME